MTSSYEVLLKQVFFRSIQKAASRSASSAPLNTEPGAVATALNLHQDKANKQMSRPLRVGTEFYTLSFLEGSSYLSAVAIAPGSALARCTDSVALQT